MNALLVDDERLARQELRRLLADHADITIVGEAVNADDAVTRLEDSSIEAAIVLFEVEGNYDARAYFGSNRPLIRASLKRARGETRSRAFLPREPSAHRESTIHRVRRDRAGRHLHYSLEEQERGAGVATPVATVAREPGLVIL